MSSYFSHILHLAQSFDVNRAVLSYTRNLFHTICAYSLRKFKKSCPVVVTDFQQAFEGSRWTFLKPKFSHCFHLSNFSSSLYFRQICAVESGVKFSGRVVFLFMSSTSINICQVGSLSSSPPSNMSGHFLIILLSIISVRSAHDHHPRHPLPYG